MRFKIKVLYAVLSLTLFVNESSAQSNAVTREELHRSINGAIQYLAHEQKQYTQGDDFYRGEWPSYIFNDDAIYLLGPKGLKQYDSNCFTTASIHNTLANFYLKHPEHSELLPMLKSANESLDAYEEKNSASAVKTYGFWHYYPLQMSHKNVLVRRPNHYFLESKFIQGAANVPSDADDTAMVLIARALSAKIAKLQDHSSAKAKLASDFLFSSYRDFHRMNLHYYNLFYGLHVRTKAFLTWFDREKVFSPLAPLPKQGKPYIPYGTNEVDCVVNSNVLSALAQADQLDTEGVADACHFINRAIERGEFNRCGVYYPNRFHFHYAAAKAIEAGAHCLDRSKQLLIDDLKASQEADGSWVSPPPQDFVQKLGDSLNLLLVKKMEKDKLTTDYSQNLVNVDRNDRLQSTLYAENALLRLIDLESSDEKSVVEKGMRFIQDQAITDSEGVHWRGGVFFAGGTLIRNSMRWRSDSYTSSVALDTLSLFEEHTETHSNK